CSPAVVVRRWNLLPAPDRDSWQSAYRCEIGRLPRRPARKRVRLGHPPQGVSSVAEPRDIALLFSSIACVTFLTGKCVIARIRQLPTTDSALTSSLQRNDTATTSHPFVFGQPLSGSVCAEEA